MDQRDVSRNSRGLLEDKTDQRYKFESSNLGAIKPEMKTEDGWHHDFEVMVLKKTVEDLEFKLSETEERNQEQLAVWRMNTWR